MSVRILLVAFGLTLSTYLFKRAAGTLNVRKLNLISYTYYLFLLQTYIGVSLMFLGDKRHYTVKYIIHESSIDKTFYLVLITGLLFPLVIITAYKILKVDINRIYNNYLSKKTHIENERSAFIIVSSISAISVFLLILLLMKIRYIPLLKIFFAENDFNFKTERIRVSQITIIHQYVKNILVLSLIPVLSFIAFTYGYITKELRWIVLFTLLFIASIVTKTYNFAKTPVIFYLFTFVIVFILLNNGIKRSYFYGIVVILGGIILGLYKVMGINLKPSLYEGPMGRVLFTQAGTLIYHFDYFPTSFPFLRGRSFASSILGLVGSKLTSVRSAKIIMAYYGSRSVYEGIAGVMNALFIGEAYANFGVVGALFSIIYVGLLFGMIFWLFTSKFNKSALNVTLLGIFTSELANTTQGGFFDFLYNANMIVIVGMFIIINYGSRYLENRIPSRNFKSKY